ncbi:Glycosyltransferase involved in cell wall bisynthesis [Frankineae bacterium MT45]|nr:Glycosyltransferase involved in cell wall bisynthesis [Frankineae bacterium MT45]
MGARRRRVLIIVQNLPVPLDRRVWLECQALRDVGVGVSVICPKGPGDPFMQEIDGVRIYKYPPPPAASGVLGYLYEFTYCWLVTALLSILVAVRDGFGAVQACNPPDTYWALALLYRPFGKRFVYDQHDLNPEVFLSRFGAPKSTGARVQFGLLRWLESMTYRTAHEVISTNESYRSIALTRGKRDPRTVTVVRSGPDTSVMRPVEPVPALRAGKERLAVYLGIMGPQDGVDQALRAFVELVHRRGRKDCHFALLGFGDCLDELKELAAELDVDEYVTFTGRVGASEIADYLSTADIGICPDPKSPLNDVSTMNKTMEYMAYCLPVISFDLVETRVSAAESAIYLPSGDLAAFAAAWELLLDDPAERARRGALARTRVAAELDWAPQRDQYVRVWQRVLGLPQVGYPVDEQALAAQNARTEDARGRRYIPLDDPARLADFIQHRA